MFCFGRERSSILPLPGGDRPVSIDGGRVWLMFCGTAILAVFSEANTGGTPAPQAKTGPPVAQTLIFNV